VAQASQGVERIGQCLTMPSYCRERAGLDLDLFSHFLTGWCRLSIECQGSQHHDYTGCTSPAIATVVTISIRITITISMSAPGKFASVLAQYQHHVYTGLGQPHQCHCGSSSVARIMAASTQDRAVIHQDAVFVTGGEIQAGGWIINPVTMVGEKKFGDIDMKNFGCKNFCGDKFQMVHYMQNLRNKKVSELMVALSLEDDPNEETWKIHDTVRIQKRILIDRLPEFITIDVETTSMMASVDVLPTWRDHEILQIELTQSNLDLLLEKPPAAAAPFKPEIEQQDVFWVKSRNSVRCTYWDSEALKRKYKSLRVEFWSDMDNEAKLDAVSSAAMELQEFFDAHHNQEGNMPEPKRGRGSSDEDRDCGEPVPKDSRTEAADTEYEPE